MQFLFHGQHKDGMRNVRPCGVRLHLSMEIFLMGITNPASDSLAEWFGLPPADYSAAAAASSVTLRCEMVGLPLSSASVATARSEYSQGASGTFISKK